MKTSERLAKENNLSAKTVRRYAKDSEFFNELQEIRLSNFDSKRLKKVLAYQGMNKNPDRVNCRGN